jgi:hypothetical protein
MCSVGIGLSDTIYIIKCPKCSARAVAHMQPSGKRGSYREVFIKMGARRIVCEACGFFKEVPLQESDDYELWYAANFKGHRLWARNRRHLAFLTSWISGNRSRAAADRSAVEDFPKWIILAKNRAGILKCLSELSNKDANKTVQRTRASRSAHRTKRASSAAGSRR